MGSQKEMMEQMMEKVTREMVENIKNTIITAVEQELTASLTKALVESEFHKKLNSDMRTGLKSIYQEIAVATSSENASVGSVPMNQEQTDKLFNDASQQLDEILHTTEDATMKIMEIVEKHMDLQNKASEMLKGLRKTRKSNPAIQELISINEELGENLMQIMTSLSFQDLTGQRIKKIITALQKIDATVFELFMSTGLLMKAHEETPDKPLEELEQEAKQKVSELKGPQVNSSQEDIDDLLGQLGL